MAGYALSSLLHDLARSLQETKPWPVSDGTAIDALAIMYGHAPRTADELVVYLAAANVLNAYVKQARRHVRIWYEFKDLLVPIAHQVASGRFPGAYTYTFKDDDGMSVTLFQVDRLQFGFHRIPLDTIPEGPGVARLAFDGVKKQRCAAELLSAASTMNAA